VSDFDLTALYDENKSLNEGALTIPGYTHGRLVRPHLQRLCGFFDPDKPIKKYTKKELARPPLQGTRPRSRSTTSTSPTRA
jgi:hypothetical protein